MRAAGCLSIKKLLESDHKEVLTRADRLIEDLRNLHCEGKTSFQKNLGRIKEATRFFNEEVLDHLHVEEEVLFPYLETHLPRLGSAIKFLLAEHEDFKNNLKIFRFLVGGLSGQRRGENRLNTMERVKETGTYLAYLLRHHIEAEHRSVYQSCEKELHQSELDELLRRVRRRDGLRKIPSGRSKESL